MIQLAYILFPKIDPILFHLGPFGIHWYGIAYLAGFVVAYLVLRRMARRQTLAVPQEALADLMTWIAAGVIVGGRLGWWLFYHRPSDAFEAWYEPLAIWNGGMSFHGGLIGVAITVLIWSRRMKTSAIPLLDGLAIVAPIGLFLGRLANFINAELVGRPTMLSWGVVFPGENFARHPSQLYEALLEGPILFLFLFLPRRIFPHKQGATAATFMVLYGLFRFAVEFTRQPDSQVGFVFGGWATMGQILSAAMILIGAVMATVALTSRRSQHHRDSANRLDQLRKPHLGFS